MMKMVALLFQYISIVVVFENQGPRVRSAL